jgi:phospholipid/cholesterol/gamma-HCH transport system substrate-binding protein
MINKSNSFQTGIFVFLGILLFGATFYILSSDENIFSGRSRVHSYFKDTQGLMFGSTVSFSGITIGNVKSISYDGDRKALRVEYTIKNSFLPFIKKDSKAQLKTQGALGDRFVFISGGQSESPSIDPGDEIEAKPSDDIFSAVQEKISEIPDLGGVAKKLEDLLSFLNSEEGLRGNSREIKLTLKEVRKAVASINKGQHTQKSLKRIDSVLKKIDEGQGTLGKLISDPSLYNKINGFLGGKESTSTYLKSMGRKSIEKIEDK